MLSEIALGRTRISELLERIQKHGGGTWEIVSAAWDDLQDALNASEPDALQIKRAMNHMESVIKTGMAVDYNWRLIDAERDRLANLVSKQSQREEKAQGNLNAQQAMVMLTRIVQSTQDAILRHVDDDTTRRRIMADISADCRNSLAASGAAPVGRLVEPRE